MEVTTERVKHIAKLSRLEIDEKELDSFVKHFNNILAYVKKLDDLDTTNIEPTAQVLSYGNVMREDIVVTSFTQEEALMNAPEQKDGGYLVPRVMEGGGA